MPEITFDFLRKFVPKMSGARGIAQQRNLEKIAEFMPDAVKIADLSDNLRMAHFLAQTAHESDRFCATEEYASGSAYEGRKDLGNIERGDGKRFKGRGLIQITGRANYQHFTDWARRSLAPYYKGAVPDFVETPQAVEEFPAALFSACWYWHEKHLNKLADDNDLMAITRRINGGLNGLAERRTYFQRARLMLDGQTPTV